MEALTLACLQHLPTAVLFVLDLTGECGTTVAHQWLIRQELRTRFPAKPWLDVMSKADLLVPVFAQADEQQGGSERDDPFGLEAESSKAVLDYGDTGLSGHESGAVQVAAALPEALRVSSVTSTGLQQLKTAMLDLLARERTHSEQIEADLADQDGGVVTAQDSHHASMAAMHVTA